MSLWPHRLIGDPANPPIFFLHGFLGRGDDWLRIASELSGLFYCVLPDLPGHGANTNLAYQFPLDFQSLNNGLINLMEGLEIQQAHWVGYSLGGRAALFFAVHFPAQVLSLSLESASPGLSDPVERRARAGEDDARANMIHNNGMETFVEYWYSQGLFQSLNTYPDLRAEIRSRRKLNDPAWMAKVISDLSPGRQPPVWNHLPRLTMPVLLMAGEFDLKFVDLARRMAAHIPQAQSKVVGQAGHTIHLEQPEKFLFLLQDFLKGLGTIHL